MELEAWTSKQPAVDEGCLVGAVIVQDEVHVEVRRYFRVNAIQELAKFGRAMSAM